MTKRRHNSGIGQSRSAETRAERRTALVLPTWATPSYRGRAATRRPDDLLRAQVGAEGAAI
jgi:hypothetical protein